MFSTGGLDMLSAFTMACAGARASLVLYARLVAQLFHYPLGFHETQPRGRTLNLLSADTDEVDLVMPFTIRSMINLVLQTALYVGVIVFATPVFVCTLPLLSLMYFVIQVQCFWVWSDASEMRRFLFSVCACSGSCMFLIPQF